MSRKHFIMVGRTSPAIAGSIVHAFGHGEVNEHGPIITTPGNVIQSRFGTFGDGESIFELFVSGKLTDHPIEQNLSLEEKKKIVRGLEDAHVTIIHSISGENTSSRAMSLLDGISDLKTQYGVKKVRLIAPHLPYMRNDRRFRKITPDGGEERQYNAVSAQKYAQRLKNEDLNDVIGFEPHSRDGVEHYMKIFNKAARFLNTGDFFANDLAQNFPVTLHSDWNIAVGSPDGLNKPNDYGIARARNFGSALYKGTDFEGFEDESDLRDVPYMFGIHKERIDDKRTEIVEFHGNVEGKIAVIVDDIFSSGGTTLQAAEALKKRGAQQVIAVATHGVLINGALERMIKSDFLDGIYVTDTIPGSVEKAIAAGLNGHSKLHIKTIAPMILDEIQKIIDDHDLKWTYPVATP
jgi:phosphoribosylpyrophosphate synthetase